MTLKIIAELEITFQLLKHDRLVEKKDGVSRASCGRRQNRKKGRA